MPDIITSSSIQSKVLCRESPKWLSTTYTIPGIVPDSRFWNESLGASPPLDSQNDMSLDLGLTSARFHTLLLPGPPQVRVPWA